MTAGDAALAMALLAIDPQRLGGVILRGRGGPARDQLIHSLCNYCPDRRLVRLPPHTGEDRLSGSLDVAETLRTGKPVHDRGLLAQAHGAWLLLASAERLSSGKAALITTALDEDAAAFALIICDEGGEDEQAPPGLAERTAFLIDLDTGHDDEPVTLDAANDLAGNIAVDVAVDVTVDVTAARARVSGVRLPDAILEALCRTALALGLVSLRPAVLAAAAACAAAALAGRQTVTDADAACAARLVLAPRARVIPAAETEEDAAPPPPPPPPSSEEAGDSDAAPSPEEISELLLAAVKAALPPGLLAALEAGLRQASGKPGAGAAATRLGLRRGRPLGSRPGQPRNGARLALIDTLRAAAPWQPLRRREQPGRNGLIVARGDLRIRRFKPKQETTAIFVVDASGSAAMRRMAEAKGAIELLLADCYVRRDRTALISFRGTGADLLLPPTRSLQRAKKSLADLPGGGGTPLAAGIEQAISVADQVRRAGGTPLAVFLTDGKANVTRSGGAGRTEALQDADAAARALRASGLRALMIDLADAGPGPARRIAEAMGASYLALPHADAAGISRSVSAAMKATP
jgi:magnesium chelatase subunit D